MNEAEWLAATDPGPMLEFLRGSATNRKLRLFAAACCRHACARQDRGGDLRAVEFAERLADGTADPIQWGPVAKAAQRAANCPASSAAYDCILENASRAAAESYYHAAWAVCHSPRCVELESQTCLLRCVCGNPFWVAAVDAAWLAWNNGVVVRLAVAAYQERELPSGYLSTSRLALVADALEDAGCADAEILSHLRLPGPHVRGCWPLDLVLLKS